jgi:hypothetical protein
MAEEAPPNVRRPDHVFIERQSALRFEESIDVPCAPLKIAWELEIRYDSLHVVSTSATQFILPSLS